MVRLFSLSAMSSVGLLAAAAHGQVTTSTFVINELDSVQAGGNTRQFVELFNAGLTPVNLSQFTLAFFDGDAALNARYMAIALTGTLAPGAYYVVGNAAVPNVNQTFAAGALQTGVDAVILFRGTNAPSVPVPTDILNFTDAIVYGQNQLPDFDLLTPTGEAPFQYNEDFGTALAGPNAAAASLSRTNGVDAIPFQIGNPTPGAANQIVIPVPAVVPVPEPGAVFATSLLSVSALSRRRR